MNRSFLWRWAGPLCLSLLSLSPSVVQADEPIALGDWLKANPDSMRRGMLSVTASEHPSCVQKEPSIASLDPVTSLLPPLLEGLTNSIGQYLVAQSGRGRQSMAMDGYTNTYFYCVQTKPLGSDGGGSAAGDQQIIYHFNPTNLTITTPASPTTGESAFSAELQLQASEDGKAFQVIPRSIDYRAPIINHRAYGVLLQLAIQDLQGQVRSVILPLGFNSCGRVRHRCTEANNKAELASVASPWLPLPVITENPTSSELKGNSSRGGKLGMPVTIMVRVLEISSYNQILASIGDFLTLNKAKISDAIVASLPPLTEKDRAAARKAQADSFMAKQIYRVAKNYYFSTIRDNKSCNDQLDAWQKAIQAGLEADVLSGLVNSPPPACQVLQASTMANLKAHGAPISPR